MDRSSGGSRREASWSRDRMSLSLAVIIGSTRPNRIGPAVATWFRDVARKHSSFDVGLIDLASFGLPLLDEPKHPKLKQYQHEHTRKWSEAVEAADAFVFVTPEYDHFPPASLINAIQCLLREWAYKPAGIVSYGGQAGGVRAAQMLRPLLSTVGVVAIPQAVSIQTAANLADGQVVNSEQIRGNAEMMLDELAKWAGALRTIHA